MAGVSFINVKKSFDDLEIIHGIDLDINDGEFVVFVGPSGCGKSTLLRLIAGLEESTSGAIKIGDQDVTRVESAERGVAMVFQSYALYPHMSVYDNMAFGLKMNRVPKDEIEKRVQKAAHILELEELLERKPKALSGGQRQRVAIGRSIVRNPKVFLLDEPLSNLDAELRTQMRVEIAKLHNDLGATMIYVTHDQTEAMTLADRIVVLRLGNVEQIGSPIDLYDNPNNQFVAGFIGSPRMNFINGVVQGSDGQMVKVFIASMNVELQIKARGDVPSDGEKIVVGMRPEHFLPVEDTKDTFDGHVAIVEQMGGISYLYVDTSDGRITIESKGHSAVAAGDMTTIGLDAENAFLFKKDGERI